jgi:two-component sensor histidine kinase
MRLHELILEAPDLAAVKRARSWVEQHLMSSAPDGSPDDALLVTSELVTNAVRHGPTSGRVVVTVVPEPDRVTISVTDSGGGVPEVQARDIDRVGGLGLQIVESVAVNWGTDVTADATRVWAIVAL